MFGRSDSIQVTVKPFDSRLAVGLPSSFVPS